MGALMIVEVGCPSSVIVNVLDYDIWVSEFELQSELYYEYKPVMYAVL